MKRGLFVEEYPHLLHEWDCEANFGMDPYHYTSGSHQVIHWKCREGHTWPAPIAKRCTGQNCPYCSGRLPIVGVNDLATTHPRLATEWHSERNAGLLPTEVTAGSGKKVWWKCENGHEWPAYICNRALKNYGCRKCSKHEVVIGENDLPSMYPKLAQEWDYEKNGVLTPQMVSIGSHKTVWWRCEKGHEWPAQIKSRVAGCGCRYCTNQDVWVGYNDLQTTNPELVVEWNWEKNEDILPTQVMAGGTRYVWWKCSKGHEWNATIVSRTHMNSGCPKCAAESQTSFPEQAILYYLSKATTVCSRYHEYGKEIDVYLPLLNVGIEYNGYWHTGKEEQDKRKVDFFAAKGIRIITVKEGAKNCITNDCIEYVYDHIRKETLAWTIESVFAILSLPVVSVDIYRDMQDIFSQYIVSEKENCLANRFPQLVEEWHPTKNGSLTPWNVTFGSGKRVYWRCERGHEWTAVIYSRANGNGCPYCAGRLIAEGENDLATTHPGLAQEWNIEKNGGLTAQQVTFGSHKKVWWICKCGNEWEAVIAKRAQGQGCKVCAQKAKRKREK